ncbi:YkvA family protein [Oscillatoria sp. CS-180]|uniref:YkvA family protein n=1 Tax=Oscillatoria sp. CS-180 TaxID=3021720 RepID=UPI00232ED4CA|nr:YkvA family protein [Oscillatoria sp. CS-180]MDB9527327.1 YkvA family protein [Oscillatoria sp. CS-180]
MKRLFHGSLTKWLTNLIRNPRYRWFVIFGSLLYLISPLDISPDAIPIIGWIDDGLLATIVVTELAQIATEKRRKSNSQSAQNVEQPTDVIDVESVAVG